VETSGFLRSSETRTARAVLKARTRMTLRRRLLAVLGCLVVASSAPPTPGATGADYSHPQKQEGQRAYLRGSPGTDYYVSSIGDDSNPGTSPEFAWRTISKANEFSFAPGDRLLLESGQTFQGTLRFDNDDVGTSNSPITVSSLGHGAATIDAGHGDGIQVHNTRGFHISDLNVVSKDRTTSNGSGILVENDLPGDAKLEGIAIDRVRVSGFGRFGILIAGKAGKSGFRDVRITNTVTHDNSLAGIYVYGELSESATPYAHENVYVGYCTSHSNPGIPGPSLPNSGSGIVLSNVNGGLIERSIAHGNGWLSDSTQGGPVGIWAWESHNITIQHNESYGNRTGGNFDGGGFDLDGGITNSTMQYNYSHDNDGPGYLMAQFEYAHLYTNNVVRYNISHDDGRKNRYGSIHLSGDIGIADVYNNTIITSPSLAGNPGGIYLDERVAGDIRFRNNALQIDGRLRMIEMNSTEARPVFQGNNYFSASRTVHISWLGFTFGDLGAWRSATGQERIGDLEVGLAVNPRLEGSGASGVLDEPQLLEGLSAYRLMRNSPLVDSGLDLTGSFGLDPGPRDFYGNRIPQGAGVDIGAHELEATVSK
jgi:hypothetical protein